MRVSPPGTLRTMGLLGLLGLLGTAASAREAAAEPAPSTEPAPSAAAAAPARPATYDLGVRIGGYGFKREGDDRPGEGWTECRMNGIGVFASRSLVGPLFVEAGLDMYASIDIPPESAAMDLPIDR